MPTALLLALMAGVLPWTGCGLFSGDELGLDRFPARGSGTLQFDFFVDGNNDYDCSSEYAVVVLPGGPPEPCLVCATVARVDLVGRDSTCGDGMSPVDIIDVGLGLDIDAPAVWMEDGGWGLVTEGVLVPGSSFDGTSPVFEEEGVEFRRSVSLDW